ncbi:MAG: nuclear transport factor 2 family protein [Acidobacteria bacterium]|nr:nuclear transport factor 2 family protein [Acidobacteriota bacterium]
MDRLRLLVFPTAALAALILASSCTAGKDPARIEDRVAIEQLMWDYIQALDSGDAERYAALFTPEGEFKGVNMSVKGHDALKNMIAGSGEARAAANQGDAPAGRLYHVVTNPHIEFIGQDRARFHAYWMGALSDRGVTSAGREVNDLVRVDGRWLIDVRDVAPKD